MKIFLVRHGQTDWNAAGKIQGHFETSLTELGKSHAQHSADFLKDKKLSAIYSSDLLRARQTSEAISSQTGAKIVFARELRDIDSGKFVGKTWKQVGEEFSPGVAKSAAGSYDFVRPEGESYAMVEARARPLLEKILSTHSNQNVAIVSHDITGHVIMRVLLGLEKEETVQLSHPQDCVYEIGITNGGKSVAHHRQGQRAEGLLKRE